MMQKCTLVKKFSFSPVFFWFCLVFLRFSLLSDFSGFSLFTEKFFSPVRGIIVNNFIIRLILAFNPQVQIIMSKQIRRKKTRYYTDETLRSALEAIRVGRCTSEVARSF